MANMFTNYENGTQFKQSRPHFCEASKKDSKIITNIKGDFIGVRVNKSNPLQLYFHLENTTYDILGELLPGSTKFEILTTTGKSIVTKDYITAEILDQYSGDLSVYLSQDELIDLKKETYAMKVTLTTASTQYEVFAEKDGYLIVR